MFRIEIETDNDAFENKGEVSRILSKLAEQIEANGESGMIRDVNGNTVGQWRFYEAEETD